MVTKHSDYTFTAVVIYFRGRELREKWMLKLNVLAVHYFTQAIARAKDV